MEKEEKDGTLSKIILLVEGNISRLRESNLMKKNGIYVLKNFEVQLSNSMCSREGTTFDFWRKGKKDEMSARLIGNQRAFVLFMKGNRIVFEDYAGLRIEEHVKGNLEYPHFQFNWTGVGNEMIAKGVLEFFRVDFSGSDFVNYYYNRNGSYNIFNPLKHNLYKLGLPKDLTKVQSVLGKPVARKIDFDARKNEIMKMSGLEELCREINEMTK